MELLTPASENAELFGLLNGETPADLVEVREELLADWRPRGATERMLVEYMAMQQWKLRRMLLAEELCLDAKRNGLMAGSYSSKGPASVEKTIYTDAGNPRSSLHALQLKELRADRAIHRAITQLLALRKARRQFGARRKLGGFRQQAAGENPAEVVGSDVITPLAEKKTPSPSKAPATHSLSLGGEGRGEGEAAERCVVELRL